MKKVILVALSFILMCLVLVNGTFAMPDLNAVFADLTQWLGELGVPIDGGNTIDVDIISDKTLQNLFPGSDVSRTFKVENCGTGDVFFRLVYAIQYDEESWPKLDINFSTEGVFFTEERSGTDGLNENGYDAEGWKDITINNTPYKMKVFTYTNALPAGTTSPEVTISIAMDSSVTSEQLSRYRSDFLQTQVLAIETTSFSNNGYATAVEALDAALPLNTLNPF